jgi:hypothetical protein
MLGFHTSFYHSWRGDTPDEAGFGTDMRVIRGILDLLDGANAAGKQARGYWDADVYWTFQEIVPVHCPDILERIRARVAAGQDEIVLGPFNNGANHAATADEFRAAVAWAIENPWGSGLRQSFPKVTPFYRSQETMFTTGQEIILKKCGVDGLMMYYALAPFNTLSTFTPALPLERRYNPFWFRSREDGPPLVVFPCIAATDLLEMTSLETLMLDLHARQRRGEIQSDVVIHLNEDADLETWLPMKLPALLKWFPNTGGLQEYIDIVNKYPWADFTVPGEYLAGHPPKGEMLVRQDLADGGFDGNYSWAEKCSSLRTWTVLEKSRLASYRAEALAKRTALDLRGLLWEGMGSAFFQRLIGLSTTHFGMSTPVINAERQARAFEILGKALQLAQEAERQAATAIVIISPSPFGDDATALPGAGDSHLTGTGAHLCLRHWRGQGHNGGDILYEFELYPTSQARDADPVSAKVAVRLPLILPAGVEAVELEGDGEPVRAALTERIPLPDGRSSCQVRFVAATGPASVKCYRVRPASASAAPAPRLPGPPWSARPGSAVRAGAAGGSTPSSRIPRPAFSGISGRGGRPVELLQNEWLDVAFSEQTGVRSFRYLGEVFGRTDFLQPFVSYRTKKQPLTYPAAHWECLPLNDEHWDGCSRVRLRAAIPMQTPYGEFTSQLIYTFTLFDDLPHLYVDVEARYAATPCTETIHNMTQKLRRLMDLRWVEVSPFQLHPATSAPAGQPLRVWKHNYLGVTSHYDLEYGRINPRNRDLDSFNHQATAGWVAVSDGKRGLLLGENAEALASMAFCPMRLREQDGVQSLWLNPFGSYYGRQLDYSHLGANGIGADFLMAFSGALKPNGPSYNGQTLRFSLLLAPYLGDEPPAALQAEAGAHFYPPGILFQGSPEGVDALLPDDIRAQVEAELRQVATSTTESVSAPTAFLVNPSQGQADLVWDPPRDLPVTGYEIAWRANSETEWQIKSIPSADRHTVPNLQDGIEYAFKLRVFCGSRGSDWTAERNCIPGAVTGSGLGGFSALPMGSLLRMVFASLFAVVRAKLGYRRNM